MYRVPAGNAVILPSPRLSVVALWAFAVLVAVVGLEAEGAGAPHPAMTTAAAASGARQRVPNNPGSLPCALWMVAAGRTPGAISFPP